MTSYSEWGQPSGAFAGQAPKGTVLVIHGGAWLGGVESGMDATHPYVRAAASRHNARGWRTLNVNYVTASSPGHEFDGYNDLKGFVAIARYNIGNAKPVVIHGMSAGAHYGAMLTRNEDIDAAILEAAPFDLPHMPDSIQPIIASTFGGYANFLSPINYAADFDVPLAIGTVQTDAAVPISTQGQPFVDRVNATGKIAVMPAWLRPDPNGTDFSHLKAVAADVTNFRNGEKIVLDQAIARRV
jgi:hypothetical protein